MTFASYKLAQGNCVNIFRKTLKNFYVNRQTAKQTKRKGKTMFNKNIDKETIKILMNENKRLKRENQRIND